MQNSEEVKTNNEDHVIAGIDISTTTDMTGFGNWVWQCDGVHCSKCNYKLQMTGLPIRCPKCFSPMK